MRTQLRGARFAYSDWFLISKLVEIIHVITARVAENMTTMPVC